VDGDSIRIDGPILYVFPSDGMDIAEKATQDGAYTMEQIHEEWLAHMLSKTYNIGVTEANSKTIERDKGIP